MSSYLFVLCPPYSGSTVLWKLLSTSGSVSALPAEGQFLPELKEIMRARPWDAGYALPWPEIKRVWESYWDREKPVLLEKSPPNLIRTGDLLAHFEPVRFIVMVRNPYAQSEGLIRRNKWNIRKAANFSLMCLRRQRENARDLDNAMVLTYESLVQDPAGTCERLTAFVPELGELDITASFEVHSIDGTLNRPITDLNAKKIEALGPDTISTLNTFFAPQRETLEAWGYQLLTPDVAAPTPGAAT